MAIICVAFVACGRGGGAAWLYTMRSSEPGFVEPGSSRGSSPGLRLALSFALFLAPLGNLGNELADNRIAEGFEILCHHDEGARSADDIGAVIVIEPAGRIGVLRIPRQRSFAQDRESIDRDTLRHRLIAEFGHSAAGIIGAVTGNIDGLPARAKRRAGELGHSEFDGAADRSA